MSEKVLKDRINIAKKAILEVRKNRSVFESVFAYSCVGLLTWIETGELKDIRDSNLRKAVEEFTSKGEPSSTWHRLLP